MSNLIKRLKTALVDMVYPPCCEVCGRALVEGERCMCLTCYVELPRTGCHLRDESDIHHRLVVSSVPFERLAVYMHYYSEGNYSRLIRRGKYSSRPDLIEYLTERFADELPDDWFKGIDILLPMGMARMKKLRRGYNQAETIARVLSLRTGIPIGDNLRCRSHRAQASQHGATRRLNASGNAYVIAPDELDGQHLLLIDDVITTGATMIDAMETVHDAAPTARISLLALGATHLR